VTVYVDDASIPYKGKLRYHMTADSKEELHAFAAEIGVKRCWYHKGRTHPHYDITGQQRAAALLSGALSVDTRKVLAVARGLVGGSVSDRDG